MFNFYNIYNIYIIKMPSISTIQLRIKLFTNFQDEPILFSKNFFHTDDKEFSFALQTPAIGEYPFISTNVEYKSDLFTSEYKYKIREVAEIVFNEDKLVGYLTKKYGKTDQSVGKNINNNDKNCIDNKCTSEIIQNNVLITLMSLFPVSFPTINNIIDSHTLLFGSTAPHFFSSTTMNEVITNKFYETRYSYLKNEGKIYTFSKLIWLNDVLNHPHYSKFIKKFHKYYQYLLNNYELNNTQELNEYIKDIDELLNQLFVGPYTNVLIPFVTPSNEKTLRDLIYKSKTHTQITTGGARSKKNGTKKKQGLKGSTRLTFTKKGTKKVSFNQEKPVKILTDLYKNNILRLIFIKHILLKLKSDNVDEINVEYMKETINIIYNNISEQLEREDKRDTFNHVKNEIKETISQYDGNVFYNSEDAFENLLNDKKWKDKKLKDILNAEILRSMTFDENKKSSFNTTKNIDELYKNMDSNTLLDNLKTFYTHLLCLADPSYLNINSEFVKKGNGFDNIKQTYSRRYESDTNRLLDHSILYELIFKIQESIELKNNKNINSVRSSKPELSKVGEVIQYSQITSEFGRGTSTNKYGASSNKLLNDLITKGKLETKKTDNNIVDISKYSKYYPINDKTIKNIHDYDYIESIYNEFYEGESNPDIDRTILEYIMNTGISIKTDIEGGGSKWAEIYVIADFLEGEVNDENISEIKCKYYNEKLGLLIDDMIDVDNEYTNWNVQSSRLYIRDTPGEQDNPEQQYLQTQQNGIMPPGQQRPGPGGIMPQGQLRPGPGGIMPQGQPIKGDEENITRNFTDFVLNNDVIKAKLLEYNNNNTPIPETTLGKHIQEKNPLFFDLIRTWNNIEQNKFDSQFISNYKIKASKVKSDIDQQIETEDIRLKQPNINQEQEYQFNKRKNRYELYKVIIDEIKKNGDSLVSDSKL